MFRVEHIVYSSANGKRGSGDLYVPDEFIDAPLALVIHGGGWDHLDKYSHAGVAQFLCEQGYAAFNINYRLLSQSPWPACLDDCIAAAEFAINGEHEMFTSFDRSKVLLVGAVSGGHLATMAGLRMPPEYVSGIITISLPADLPAFAAVTPEAGREFWRHFFGCEDVTEEMMKEASPLSHVTDKAPPLLLLHNLRDTLVDVGQSRKMAAAYKSVGCQAELLEFEGVDNKHGIWIPDSNPHRLTPNLEDAIATFLANRCK